LAGNTFVIFLFSTKHPTGVARDSAGNPSMADKSFEAGDRVFHIHAKDISMAHGAEERGKVTGTPVGCACGEGVVDWERVAEIMAPVDREIFLSVECGKIDEAERGISYLNKALAKWLV
jgi:sugar phosphate isomerase/epimerase